MGLLKKRHMEPLKIYTLDKVKNPDGTVTIDKVLYKALEGVFSNLTSSSERNGRNTYEQDGVIKTYQKKLYIEQLDPNFNKTMIIKRLLDGKEYVVIQATEYSSFNNLTVFCLGSSDLCT